MKFLKKVLSLLCVFLLLISCVISAGAINYDYDKPIESETVLLINMDTGIPVLDINASEVRYPASLTKIMSFIVVSEHIKDFDNTRIEIKQSVMNELLGTGSMTSGVDQKVGEKMTVTDLVHCMLVASGNDAALVLADYVGGGSIKNFVDMMNEKALELGCKNTHFMNPHGLHDPQHYTTAYDLYTITSYALTLPRFSEITNTATYYCEGDDYPITTTNYLIDINRGGEYYYTYAKGIKTGTTDEAGRCLITTAIADGYAYMCICLGAPYQNSDHNGAMRDAAGLMKWALLNLDLARMLTTDTPVCEVKVNFSGKDEAVLLYPVKTVNSILPRNYKNTDITVKTDVSESVDAPIKVGDVLGTATVYYKGEAVNTVDLTVSEDIERSDIAYTMFVLKGVFTSWQFIVAAVIAVILVIVYIALVSSVKQKKKQKRVKKYRRM